MKQASVSALVAMSENRVIGRDGKLPWDIPEDLKFFRSMTRGHVMIMGRKTYESIGRPLPNRISIIITRNKNYKVEGCFVVASLDEAMAIARSKEKDEIFIIGGGEIFKLAMPIIDKLYLTLVKTTIEGDAYFPDYAEFNNEVSRRESSNGRYDYTFLELTR